MSKVTFDSIGQQTNCYFTLHEFDRSLELQKVHSSSSLLPLSLAIQEYILFTQTEPGQDSILLELLMEDDSFNCIILVKQLIRGLIQHMFDCSYRSTIWAMSIPSTNRPKAQIIVLNLTQPHYHRQHIIMKPDNWSKWQVFACLQRIFTSPWLRDT